MELLCEISVYIARAVAIEKMGLSCVVMWSRTGLLPRGAYTKLLRSLSTAYDIEQIQRASD